MKKVIIVIFILFSGINLFANNEVNSVTQKINILTSHNPVDCSAICSAAINNAIDFESDGYSWCMEVQTTGQGYSDCCTYFHAARIAMVNAAYQQFENCESGPGGVINAVNRLKKDDSKS